VDRSRLCILIQGALAWSGWNCGPFWLVKGLLVAAAVVVLAVVVVVLVLSVLSYNRLVRRRDQVDSAWSQVDIWSSGGAPR
jgi:Flp pilus assembly protein TadB